MGRGVPGIDRYTLAVAIMAEQWRILVVEGEENLNWNIVNSLQKDGYLVLGVTGGSEAIRTLWSEEYDIVICSQQMPDADGFDLLQWMRTYCPNTRMVMLGTPGGSLNRTQALEMGVTSYLEKPLDIRALKEELRRLLHQTGFSASLDSFDLLDVIQIINMSRKSIALVVNTGLEEQGTLRFQTGELIWAEYGTLRGEEAFFALAAHKNGTVVHRPWNDQITPNVTQPLSRLIFQALQYRSKYAERQQLSSEIEAIRPGGMLPDPPTLPPLPPSTTLPSTLQDLEEDDRPFQFVEEDDTPFQFATESMPHEQSPALASPFTQFAQNGATNGHLEGNGLGTIMHTEPSEINQPAAREKEWWEPTGSFPRLQMSGSMRAITDDQPQQLSPSDDVSITPSLMHKSGMAQTSALPSWLTDQPTNLSLPVLRGNTGQMPAAPKTPPTPAPVPPVPLKEASAQWPALPQTALNPSDSGLRKMKPEETSFTTPHRVIKPAASAPPAAPLRSAPPDWQSSVPAPPPGQTGQMSAIKTQGSGEMLQSLAALKKNGASPAPAAGKNGASVAPAPAPKAASSTWETPISGGVAASGVSNGPGKRNYPALAAALQTLGYSVPGFVAAAVIGLDGLPIAQVTMDETDISPLCAQLGLVIQGTLQAMKQGNDEGYEYTTITSRTQHILLRLIGKKPEAFQALITLRETDPAQSLEVMANVEAALAAALQ